MSVISEMTREKWLLDTFPEWGTWLTEEIESEVVPEGQTAMWWLGCVGIWFKTPGGANISLDLWCGNGKRCRRSFHGEYVRRSFHAAERQKYSSRHRSVFLQTR